MSLPLGFIFPKKFSGKKTRQFRILVVRASQPTWQGHCTTPVGQTFTPASQMKTRISVNMAPRNKFYKIRIA
jgi:hypothetical protein